MFISPSWLSHNGPLVSMASSMSLPNKKKKVLAASPATSSANDNEGSTKPDEKKWDEGNGARYAGYSARAARVLGVVTKSVKAGSRYVAYSSDVGEAARPLVSPTFVRAMYGVAFAYVGYDVYAATSNAMKTTVEGGKSEDQIKTAALRAGSETLYFQALASILVPSLIIHSAVHKSQQLVKTSANVTLKRYGPTALGLAIIPILPFTIDEPIEHFVEYTFGRIWPDEDHAL